MFLFTQRCTNICLFLYIISVVLENEIHLFLVSLLRLNNEHKLKLKHKMSTAANSHWTAKRNQKSRNARTLFVLSVCLWVAIEIAQSQLNIGSDFNVTQAPIGFGSSCSIHAHTVVRSRENPLASEFTPSRGTNEDNTKCAGLKVRMSFSPQCLSLSLSVAPTIAILVFQFECFGRWGTFHM